MDFEIPRWAHYWIDAKERILAAHSGRGAGKTEALSRVINTRCLTRPNYRVLLIRETYGAVLGGHFATTRNALDEIDPGKFLATPRAHSIRYRNGSSVNVASTASGQSVFRGITGYDLVWFDEAAHFLKDAFWIDFEPSFRKEGSQIWLSFNPRHRAGVVEREFVFDPRPDAHVDSLSWRDNPWFKGSILSGMRKLAKARMPRSLYQHVWEGSLLLSEAFIDRESVLACARRPDDMEAGKPFMAGVDQAFAGPDFTAIAIADQNANFSKVIRFREPNDTLRFHRVANEIPENIQIIVDNSMGHSDALCNYLEREAKRKVVRLEYRGRRAEMYSILQRRLYLHQMTFPAETAFHPEYGTLEDELIGLVRDDQGYVDHVSGRHDDMACAMMHVTYMLEQPVAPRMIARSV